MRRGASPESLNGEGSAGGEERERAIGFYADPGNRQESFPFKAYKAADILAALEAMCDTKCAYCETDYGAVCPVDIEHYRPKGAILDPDGTLRKPGYYWLAAEWTNLLPSCIDCNRVRGHDYEEGRGKTGKANRFPLLDESRRAKTPGEEDAEEPLLLDPTRDNPEDHLEFMEEGVIRAAMLQGQESRRGQSTIDILGLRRPRLVRDRQSHMVSIDASITKFEGASAELDRDPSNEFAKSILASELAELKRLVAPSSEYAAMARQRIYPVLEFAGVQLS